MSIFILKVFAVLAMIIDHSGSAFESHLSPDIYFIMRVVGRCAFPVFAFCVAEGCRRTKDMGKYLFRLGIFAIISELPFDMLFTAAWQWSLPQFLTYCAEMLSMATGLGLANADYSASYLTGYFNEQQNVFFTLFLGVLAIQLYKSWHKDGKHAVNTVAALLAVILTGLFAHTLKVDYGYLGVLLVFGCYFFEKQSLRFVPILIFIFLLYSDSLRMLLSAGVAILLVCFYNGQRGKPFKWAFYAFYPIHLFVLGVVGMLFN